MGRIKAPRIPPSYEFCVTDIIRYYFFTGCFSTFIALAACLAFHSLKPVLILFVLQVFLVLWLMLKRKSAQEENIPSKCYHPNLLPQDEYLAIKRQYDEACAGLYNYNFWYLPINDRIALNKSYQDIIDNVSPILNAQNELRALCLFKMEFGIVETPAVLDLLEEDSDYEDDFEDDGVEKMDENASVKTPSPADVNEVLTPEIKLHAPQLNEISIVKNKRNVQRNAPKTIDMKRQKCDWVPVRPDSNYKEEFESDSVMDKNKNNLPSKGVDQNKSLSSPQSSEISVAHYENAQSPASKESYPVKMSDMEKIMKKLEILEQLKIQFAEIKVENETLKESIEKILESQTVF